MSLKLRSGLSAREGKSIKALLRTNFPLRSIFAAERGDERRMLKLMPAILAIIFLTGCGTMQTRMGDHFFGAYPYQAVGKDITDVVDGHAELKAIAVVSIPFDIVLDTFFLPPDLILWIKGKEKDGVLSDVN